MSNLSRMRQIAHQKKIPSPLKGTKGAWFSQIPDINPPPSLRDAPRPVLGGVKNAKNGFIGAQLRPNKPIFGKIPLPRTRGRGTQGDGVVYAVHIVFGFEKIWSGVLHAVIKTNLVYNNGN
jgi:hypothetical protein